MEHLFIGLIVGIIMGLTGAGGALISIPLFITLLNASVKEATVLSLTAVLLGTGVNLFRQINKIEKKIVFLFVVFGAVANYATLPLKPMLSDLTIAGLLLAIGIYSVWSIWQKKKALETKVDSGGFFKTAIIGIGLGVITTLTGLGGGVLLVPVLMNFYGKKYEEALPTSLMTIFLISLISFLMQIEVGLNLISLQELAFIAAGAMTAFILLKLVLKKINQNKVDLTRKIVFTLVTVYSITSVIYKSL